MVLPMHPVLGCMGSFFKRRTAVLCKGCLWYKKSYDAVNQLVNPLDALKQGVKLLGSLRKDGSRTIRTQQMLYVNESGFYALVLGSKLSTAVKFKNWVTAEVS